MTKRTWIYLTVALVVLASVLATCVYASPARDSGNMKNFRKAQKAYKVAQMLGITEEQGAEIRAVVGEYRDDFKPLIEGLVDAHRDLRDVITADEYNEQAIRRAAEHMCQQKVELAVLIGKAYQDVSEILTDEQLELIDEFKEMRQNHVDDLLEFIEKLPGS